MKFKDFFEKLDADEKDKVYYKCNKKLIKNKIIKKFKKIKQFKIGEIVLFKENKTIKGLARICGFTLTSVRCRIKYIESFILNKKEYSLELSYKDNENYECELIKYKNLLKQNGKFYYENNIIKPFKFNNAKKIKTKFYYE